MVCAVGTIKTPCPFLMKTFMHKVSEEIGNKEGNQGGKDDSNHTDTITPSI